VKGVGEDRNETDQQVDLLVEDAEMEALAIVELLYALLARPSAGAPRPP
jgi:hypothetical protein